MTDEEPATNGTTALTASQILDNASTSSAPPHDDAPVAGPSSEKINQPNRSPRTSLDSPRSSLEGQDRIQQLEADLAAVRQEKDVLQSQYRSLLGKLTAMRQGLGDKLREDAVSC